MNRILITYSIILLISQTLYAQQTTLWANRTGGGAGTDGARQVLTDDALNIYAVGNYYGTVDLNPGSGSYPTVTSTGAGDIYIQKLDTDGNLIWARAFGGLQNDFIGDVVIDSLGNCYVSGSFANTVDFDPGIGLNEVTAISNWDGFLLKLNTNGEFVWVKTFGGDGFIHPRGLALDDSLNIYMSGSFDGSCDFDPGPGTTILSTGWSHVFVLKLNASGDFLWSKQLNGGGSDDCYGLTLDDQSNIYLNGRFEDFTDFNPGVMDVFAFSNGQFDAFLLKLDSDGNFIWSKTIGGDYNDVIWRTKIASDGGVLMIGKFRSEVDFDPGIGSYLASGQGTNNIFVEKLSSQGDFLWVKILKGVWDANSLELDETDNCYITGRYGGTIDFDPGVGTNEVSSVGNSGDIYILKLDASGNFSWVRSIGGSQADAGNSIVLDGAGSLIVCGTFEGSVDFDPGSGTIQLGSTGWGDAFVMKMTESVGLIDLKNKEIAVFPNPFVGKFQVDLSAWEGTLEIKLYTTEGSLVYSRKTLGGSLKSVPFKAPSGIYLLEISGNHGTAHTRLMHY